jgi:hypothetical protein
MKNNETLTGNFYHKKTWIGLILIIEVKYQKSVTRNGYATLEYFIEHRKAKEKDLQELKLMSNATF